MRYNLVLNILGLISKYIGILALVPILVAFLLHESNHILPFLTMGIVALVFGIIFSRNVADQKDIDNIKKSESLAIVFFGWVLFGLISTIPYLFYNLSFTDACFEAMSGVTTTGATIMNDFSLFPRSLFFFRSFTQWLGGMGIVVLFIAILPKISVAGRQMFYAEAPAPTEDKATPRIRFTASWLWGIYFALTVIEVVILRCLDYGWYTSIVTSLSTISTGGFSHLPTSLCDIHNAKFAICVLSFMFLSGMNYILIYRSMKHKKITPLFKSEEFKVYLGIILILGFGLGMSLFLNSHYEIKQALLNSFFEIVATMTSTGFTLDNYIKWDATSKVILFSAFFIGGCATSTSGGMKVIRWIFIFKYLKRELNKIIHPQGVYPIKLEGNAINNDVISQMMAFVVFYIVIL